MLFIVGGVNVFGRLGMEAPSWWHWATQNRIYSCLMIFFLSNAIEGHLVSTGAFEIVLNGTYVFICVLSMSLFQLIPPKTIIL